jgi:hypothetical protein
VKSTLPVAVTVVLRLAAPLGVAVAPAAALALPLAAAPPSVDNVSVNDIFAVFCATVWVYAANMTPLPDVELPAAVP